MRNRLISYVLLFASIISLFSISVSADSDYINLFDYGLVNGGDKDWFYWTSSSTSCTFNFPNYQYLNYFDFVVQLPANVSLNSVTISSGTNKWSKPMTIIPAGDRCYRIFSSGEWVYDNSIKLTFDCSRTCYITFSSATCVPGARYTYHNVDSVGDLYTNSRIGSFGNTNGQVNSIHHFVTDTDAFHTAHLTLSPSDPNFLAYDYWECYLWTTISSINSITCVSGDVQLPLEISYIYPSTSGTQEYTILIRVDLRGVNRTFDPLPIIYVYGSTRASGTDFAASILNSVGYNVPSISSFQWIDSLVSKFSYHFDNLVNSISGFFSNLNIHLSNFFNTLFTRLSDIRDLIYQIVTGKDNNSGQFNQDLDDKQQQIDDMNQVIDSVTKPSIDDINIDVSGYISSSDIDSYSSIFESIFSNNIIFSTLMIALTFTLVSFVVFGKR